MRKEYSSSLTTIIHPIARVEVQYIENKTMKYDKVWHLWMHS